LWALSRKLRKRQRKLVQKEKNKRRLGGNGEVHDSGYYQELKGGNFTFSSLGPTVLSPGADCDEDSSEDEMKM